MSSCKQLFFCSRCAAKEERAGEDGALRLAYSVAEESFRRFLAGGAKERYFAPLGKGLPAPEALPILAWKLQS